LAVINVWNHTKNFVIESGRQISDKAIFRPDIFRRFAGKQKITREEQIREFGYLTAELEKSVKEVPLDYKSELLLGQLYNKWSLIDSSKTTLADNVLRRAIALSPQNQQGYWQLAQTKIYENDIDSALALAQTAYDLYPANAHSKVILDEIRALKQKTQP